ncbi:filamentous haemagglutinin family protein [Paraburkholderia sp. ZP32-5]|uniref:filamentous haemagglutinin family protein n=1 Tax=Paraburkholderia sp. ZP32-5 TaxID=2883245 RepID=UPI001F2DA146|nr:filamentous haemagglutinin family protein [Paraburkholderia sp. ZP32-5]
MLAAGPLANAHAGLVNLANGGAGLAAVRGGAAGASGIANLGVGVSPQQALQASQPSIRNLATAAQGIAQQIAQQRALAAAGSATASNVPNGLAVGGLQVAPGVSSDTSNPNLWINANAPKQSVDASGHVTVEVDQTAQNAVATWQTMNVGQQTTLYFNQTGGTQTNGANNWVILNRIVDPSMAPSQILGNIKAEGSVYVVNRNGILFGPGSQVNVHSLVATSLDFLNQNDVPTQGNADIAASNQLFLNLQPGSQGGLAPLEAVATSPGQRTGIPNEVLGLGNQVTVNSPTDYVLPGSVTIAPGASITTHANGTVSDGGFVMVAAPNVTNGGSITAIDGQVVLAAGVGVSLAPNPNSPSMLVPALSGRLLLPTGNGNTTDVTPAGTLINTGLVEAARGNIDLLGSSVAQNGVVGVTTSVNTPGTITISTVDENVANTPTGGAYPGLGVVSTGDALATRRAGLLTFGPDSVTTVMPDDNGQTATSAPGTIFTAGSVSMTAGSIWFQSGSLVEAPGSTVSVTALTKSAALDATPPGDTAVPGRIYLDTGATIDVSGLANVELPIADILVTVPLIGGNELADSPLLRDGFLNGFKDLVFDSTLSGTRSDGVQWVGSPLLNLSGYASQISRTVDQLLVNGGTITLSGNEVMTVAGSSLNLNGGYLHYDGGMVDTTRLVDANGVIVPIGQADPNDTFVGIAGQFVDRHSRWNISNTYMDPLLAGGAYEGDFIVGGNAGTLNLFATSAMVLDGDINAQALSGSKQVQDNDQAVGGTFALGSSKAFATLGENPGSTGENGLVIVQNTAPQLSNLAPDFSFSTVLDTAALNALAGTDPNNVLANQVVPAGTLSAGGFANVSVTEDNIKGTGFLVPAGTVLQVQDGGSIALSGPRAANALIDGHLIAPSGSISISVSSGSFGVVGPENGNITVGPDALLDAAGEWVNNDTLLAPGTTVGDSEYINGGSVALSTGYGIDLQAGSVIDVSSGGEVQADGQLLMSNGIPLGKGGSVSLDTLVKNANYPDLPTDTLLHMDGTIRSSGFSGGGTLTLQALGFQIGGDPASAPAWSTALPEDFFAQQGFGSYVLNAYLDATVAPGSTVDLTQQNLIPNAQALQRTASGADLTAGGLTTVGTIDAFDRQATSLVLTAGGYVAWHTTDTQGNTAPVADYPGVTGGVTVGEGASIVADAGAHIGLGSPAQVTVLGSLIAPGGSIALNADSTAGSSVETGQYNGAQGTFTSDSKSVWLGPDAVLDVSGVALTDPVTAPVRNGLSAVIPNTGKVLPGGSVTISDDSGYVVAQAGSRIDVSGAAANFDQLQTNGQYASQPVWSDAGSITLSASSGLYFDGTLEGHAGAPQAQGASLSIFGNANAVSTPVGVGGNLPALPGATALIIQQSGELVPADLAPGQSFADAVGAPTGVLQFAADRLNDSGISTLVLGDPVTLGSTTGVRVVPVAFAGDVDLNLAQAVVVNAQTVAALSNDQLRSLLPARNGSTWQAPVDTLLGLLSSQTSSGPTGTHVTIDAPYVAFAGPLVGPGSTAQALAPNDALADGTLNVSAAFIDLENAFQLNNFGQANFTSSGDIRLSSTTPAASGANALASGVLFTPGNLTFKAADLYPSTGSTFIIDAVGPSGANGAAAPTTVTFESNGPAGVPLSAGGTLLVDATDIVQGGTVRAPSGSLIFGVGDASDAATKTQFDSLPLVATNSVTFASGSVTSVSNDGAIIPFGATVDGVEWQFNPIANANAAPDLSAPPSKFIGANGSSVALNAGATIDLSGGGDLQAAEWVPGTGGTRDVLSQYSVSFASNPSGTAVPVNVGASNVYAILPGVQAPVAAYDPIFAQSLQPTTNANGTAATTTQSAGVGQAALNGAVGQSVYLSGVPGLPAGFYTLLPGRYATLPGAYRLTVSAASGSVVPGASQTLPDGTVAVAGYWGNALTGSRSATPTLFNVQSGEVWQQYSQYTLTGANAFFTNAAAKAGNVVPQLPVDGGQLVLAATSALALGAKLDTTAGDGGAPAEIDIASQDIQIVGSGETALQGYLQISAADLNALDAGSLLIGGTRTLTTSGITIDALANSVVVSNDAADPLTGPEILLVTKTDPSGNDTNAQNGLRIDAGSVIEAQGTYPAAKDVPITIGAAADSNGTGGVSGDGSLVRVSNGADAVVTRVNTSDAATNPGQLTIGAGATLSGGQSLTLDSSGNLQFDPTAAFSANTIAVDGSVITFTDQTGEAAAALPGFVIGAGQLAQLSNTNQLILRTSNVTNFDGNVTVTFGTDVDLSAPTFASNGGAVTLNGQHIEFTNEVGASTTTAAGGNGTLTVNANEIDFGTGDRTASGFASATFNATGGIVGEGTGSFDFGAMPVTMSAPVYIADTGSNQTIKTTGALNLNAATGTALSLTPVGGELSFIGGALNDNGATISAPSGDVSLEATMGDLTIGDGSLVSSAGVAKQFFDVTVLASAGSISLTADQGTVNVAKGATLDFSGANGQGAAGSVALSAPEQIVNLNGTLKGNSALGGQGGSFSLDTGGAVDLDSLATTLASSGVNNTITVETHAGNLTLSADNTITARGVSLTADGGAGGQDPNNGNVSILGKIDASGVAGGEIDLYGRSGVDIEGSLIATGSSATQRGGAVNVGTRANPDTVNGVVQLDPTYGYESVSAANSGVITLGANALIDVSGGTAGGLSGGTVNFRAPLLNNGDVNVNVAPTAQIKGSRATTLEAYAVWSTDDPLTNGANQHFDGVVDPAGWYNGTVSGAGEPDMVNGSWTDAKGNALPAPTTPEQLANYQQNDFFTPDPNAVNTSHQAFYGYQTVNGTQEPGTLMGFVENFPIATSAIQRFANVDNFQVAPGIELDNPDPQINNGNISILSNWNLGATNASGAAVFRFGDEAPVITFRAENNVNVKASLTDGFFQIANPVTPGSQLDIYVPLPGSAADAHTAFYDTPAGPYATSYGITLSYYGDNGTAYVPRYLGLVHAPATSFGTATPDEIAAYFALYKAYTDLLVTPAPAGVPTAPAGADTVWVLKMSTTSPGTSQPPTPPDRITQANDPFSYLLYLRNYASYFDALSVNWLNFNIVPPAAPIGEGVAPLANGGQTVVITSQSPIDNSPSPVATAINPLPLQLAQLSGGTSSSYRIVAGADLNSTNPLAVQAASMFNTVTQQGNVTLSGQFGFVDANSNMLLAPTTIRTGTGSIAIAAGGNVSLFDPSQATDSSDFIVPGVIYTAGAPASGSPATSDAVTIVKGDRTVVTAPVPDFIATPAVNPDSAGDISIYAQGDINGFENVVDTSGAVTGLRGASITQFWRPWMQTGNVMGTVGTSSQIVQTSIDFGAFDQGVMSAGGNVSVNAGGDISQLAVSLPTTWYLTNAQTGNPTVNTVGGGNLSVAAGGDILSGDYFVAKGTVNVTAGGAIESGVAFAPPQGSSVPVSVPTLFAMQDATLNVTARQGVDIGGVFDPSYLQGGDMQGYSTTSAINVVSTTGDVQFGTLPAGGNALTLGRLTNTSAILPATVQLVALTGGIDIASGGQLFPSATGNLTVLADQSIKFSSADGLVGSGQQSGNVLTGSVFGMLDVDPASLPSPVNPNANVPRVTDTTHAAHDTSALHADDLDPARIYSLNGSIVDGTLEPAGHQSAGFYDNLVTIGLDKPALIQAGQDILNLAFQGQNLRAADFTRIIAGRDILDTPLVAGASVVPSLVLGGPGSFDVEAGRNIGPLTSQQQAFDAKGSGFTPGATGIEAVGNANNPNLPHESADVQVLFGIGPGVDYAAFISAYVNPASSVPGGSNSADALVAFIQQYDAGQVVDTGLQSDSNALQNTVKDMTVQQAWKEFQVLPSYVQQQFAQQELFNVMTAVGNDFNNPDSPFHGQYARGYQAINTLFPASLGYTANNLNGGSNGANQLLDTGDLDIRSTTIQTQQGGSVTILGPGGQALIGSTSAPPEIVNGNGLVVAGPGTQGILTLEQGNVDIFTDRSLLLAQSRVFTEQGGDMTIWSSNGDINAGKGTKTSADTPTPQYVCDPNHYCTVDARGEVTGAGIATLQSIPGVPPGTVDLIAPRGTVDAGDAGIRAGNLNVAALQVLNADNIQVTGKSTGIPAVAAVDTGALTAAGAATAAVTQMAQNLVRNNASGVPQRHWTISVQVEGFGESLDNNDGRKKRRPETVSYNSSSPVSVLGFGELGGVQRAYLTRDEKSRL